MTKKPKPRKVATYTMAEIREAWDIADRDPWGYPGFASMERLALYLRRIKREKARGK